MREIPLTQGKVALIDDEDYDLVSEFNWYATKTLQGKWYAKRHILGLELVPCSDRPGKFRRRQHTVLMHAMLMGGSTRANQIDHINGDGLDNRRCNLRYATSSQNNANRQKRIGTSSQFRGVSWEKRDRKWRAKIRLHKKTLHLGYFESETDAALAYDQAATAYYGPFARTNFGSNSALQNP